MKGFGPPIEISWDCYLTIYLYNRWYAMTVGILFLMKTKTILFLLNRIQYLTEQWNCFRDSLLNMFVLSFSTMQIILQTSYKCSLGPSQILFFPINAMYIIFVTQRNRNNSGRFAWRLVWKIRQSKIKCQNRNHIQKQGFLCAFYAWQPVIYKIRKANTQSVMCTCICHLYSIHVYITL